MENLGQNRIKTSPNVLIFKLFIVFVLITCLIVANFSDPSKQRQPQNLLMSFEETFQFNNHNKNLNNTIYNLKNDNKSKWNLPRYVWIFRNTYEYGIIENFNTFRQLNVLNTKHFAEKGNYQVKQINQKNYHEHLSKKSSQKVSFLIKLLEERIKNKEYFYKQIIENKQSIIKRLIIYLVLLQNGGIFVDQMTTVVEGFDTWIEDIMNVMDINLGDRNDPNLKPKCFGFYNKEFSSMKMKIDVRREFEFEKKMVAFPSLQDDLIACEKQTEFMQKLIESYLKILLLKEIQTKLQRLNKNQKFIGHTKPQYIYKYAHRIALHSILQQRQHYLNKEQKTEFKKLAIDDYGLVTINENIALYKLKNNLEVQRELFAFLAKLQIKYLSQLNGRLRFAHKLDPNIIAQFTQQLASKLNPSEFFLQNSFFHTYLLRFWPKGHKFTDYRYITPLNESSLKSTKQIIELSEPQILPQPIEQNNENNPQWQSVEKKLWVAWDKDLKYNSNLITELCFQNLKKSAANSGYQLYFVTKDTLHQYIDKQTLQRMEYALKHSNYWVQIQGQSDLWRLALMYKHGGVYVDASTFTTVESFDFVRNITRIPSGLLWNRYGSHPRHLLFWHVRFAHPSNWQIDYKYNTKKQWQLSYESSFIAAERGSELIKQWFDIYMQWMISDYSKIQQQMKQVNMWDHKWTRKQYRYLMVMDAIKYVIGRRQKWLKDTKNTQYQSASDYYKIWSMPAQMNGQQKLRGQTNYQNKDYRLFWLESAANNIYRHEFSMQHAQDVLGPLSFETKFFGWDTKYVNMFLQHFAINHKHNLNEQSLNQIIHPQSMLGRLIRVDINKAIHVMKYYSGLREIRTINRSCKVWSIM